MARFPLARLRALAGDLVLARGQEYHARGAVTLLSVDARQVLARVRGGEDYRVRLTGQGRDFGGDCSCPAFERDDWCKHLVAAALAADAAGDAVPDRLGAIRTHLLGLGTEALAALLLEQAEADPALLRRLDLAASAAAAGPADHAGRLREVLQEVLSPPDYVDYRGAGDWTDQVLETLDQIPALIAGGGAAEARALVEEVLDELPAALEMVDDSDGGGMEILHRAAALHMEACRALRPEPEAFAEELFERAWDDDGFGTFAEADEEYAEILGAAGLATYRRLAEAALAKLPKPGRDDPKAHERRWLVGVLDRFAAREGDLDRRLALRASLLTQAQDYLALAEFCLAQGRPDLALQYAGDGAFLFDDERLVLFLAGRLVAEGRAEEATAALWKAFGNAPSLALLQAWLKLAGSDGPDRALALLRIRRAATAKREPFAATALLRLEVELLLAAERLEEAWAAAEGHRIGEELLLRLATASEAKLPEAAARTYRALAEERIAQTNRGGYEAGCQMLARLARIEPAATHAGFIAELRQRHRAKRTLLPLLDQHMAKLARR